MGGNNPRPWISALIPVLHAIKIGPKLAKFKFGEVLAGVVGRLGGLVGSKTTQAPYNSGSAVSGIA